APGRDEHQLVRGAAGGPAHRANRRATRFAPGAGAPTRLRRLGSKPVAPYGGPWARRSRAAAPRGVAHLRYACVVCALTSASRCSPARDEHQLVRGAAGGPAHRASRCATLFAPGAGAPTGLRHPGGGFTAAAVFRLTRPGADPPGSAV